MRLDFIFEELANLRGRGYVPERIHMTKSQIDNLCVELFGPGTSDDYENATLMGLPVVVSDTFAIVSK